MGTTQDEHGIHGGKGHGHEHPPHRSNYTGPRVSLASVSLNDGRRAALLQNVGILYGIIIEADNNTLEFRNFINQVSGDSGQTPGVWAGSTDYSPIYDNPAVKTAAEAYIAWLRS